MTIIDDVGESVTVTEVTNTVDEYGDASESTSNTNVDAVVEILPADEEIIKSGILNVGDAIGYFDPDDTNIIKEGNRVSHNGINYVITEVTTHGIGGTNLHIEAFLKRIVT